MLNSAKAEAVRVRREPHHGENHSTDYGLLQAAEEVGDRNERIEPDAEFETAHCTE